jgi:hypothetical protein
MTAAVKPTVQGDVFNRLERLIICRAPIEANTESQIIGNVFVRKETFIFISLEYIPHISDLGLTLQVFCDKMHLFYDALHHFLTNRGLWLRF